MTLFMLVLNNIAVGVDGLCCGKSPRLWACIPKPQMPNTPNANPKILKPEALT